MPSEPIAHRAPATDARLLHWLIAFLAGLTVLIAVTACAEGTEREAREGQESDAERTSVVDDLQATNTARVLASTPTPPSNESDGD